MTTYPHRVHTHWPRINVWQATAAILAATVIALVAWIVMDARTGTHNATNDATTLIDKLNESWSAGNGSAVTTLFANDAVAQLQGHRFVGAKAIGDHATTASRFGGFRIVRTAPVSVAGDLATTLAEYRYGSSGGLGTLLTVYQLQQGKIIREWTFKYGTTAPFMNVPPLKQ